MDSITPCLGHDIRTDRPSCPNADKCQRHVVLRTTMLPMDSPLVGTACSSFEYMLFLPINQGESS